MKHSMTNLVSWSSMTTQSKPMPVSCMAWHLEASTISLINPMAAELYYYTWVAQGVTDTIIVIENLQL
jgi:hypothetical protein